MRKEMMERNALRFKQIEEKYKDIYVPSTENNKVYYGDAFENLYDVLPVKQFNGEYEMISSFIGDYMKTGVKGKCILNFASAKYPGGGVKHGSIAQEEDICRNSLLFFNLNKYKHLYDEGAFVGTDYLLDDFVIYSKSVSTVNEDLTLGETNDYITSAAPDLRLAPNGKVDPAMLRRTWVSRIMGVLGAAVKHGATELVLGPWGCGVFMNDPNMVARTFRIVLDEFGGNFTKITFLLPDQASKDAFAIFNNRD